MPAPETEGVRVVVKVVEEPRLTTVEAASTARSRGSWALPRRRIVSSWATMSSRRAAASASASRSTTIVAPPDGEVELPLDRNAKYLINPGSVGQPRDGDPRAGYAIFDSARNVVELVRLEYPLQITQQKMQKAGLPESLSRRLAAGR